MELVAHGYSAADPDFYAPLESMVRPEPGYRPSQPAAGWHADRPGFWTMWHPDGRHGETPGGWKVHVSARPDRVQHVLDEAACICFAQGVPFKHISGPWFYWWANQKYAPRSQGGKFITAYPGDVPAARRLMEALRAALDGEDGPYILSDRRFGDSRTVHYRYGAFAAQARVQADGTRVLLVRDGTGRLVPDRRGVSFWLPDGVTDPFAEAKPRDAPRPGPEPSLGGFVVEEAIQHRNFGGIYRGRDAVTGRAVFIKEARAHTGLMTTNVTGPEQLRAEWAILTELHAAMPGVAPEPVSYFREWEHEFLATEFLGGIPLAGWLSAQHPLFRAGSTPDDFARYYERCARILAALDRDLNRMHEAGYLFVDVSPTNVLVGPDDAVRLTDFGATCRPGTPIGLAGTPGYTPPARLIGDDRLVFDDYGMAGLTQLLMGPLHQVVEREPGALRHLYHDLREAAPVPAALWSRATRFHLPADTPRLPGPAEVAADRVRHLGDLRDWVADALAAMAEADHGDRVFPTIVPGYRTNTLCVAYGTAGVVHALRRAGRPLPDGVAGRLRRDALAAAGQLAPGLHVGLAGIAWVLADMGLLEEAADLLAVAGQHPLAAESATLYGGSSGVALAHLALYGHTGDEFHVDRALALAAALPADGDLAPYLGKNDAVGLTEGRCGIALMLQQLSAVTGDCGALTRAGRLLHAELDRAVDPAAPGLLFPASAADRRAVPSLFCGSAGLALTITRYLRAAPDDRLASALPRLLAPLRLPYCAMPALFLGQAGLAFALAEHAQLTGDDASSPDAVAAACRLFKYAIPHPTGVRFLGSQLQRYSAELWSGSAGILLALTHVLSPRPDPLFTVDGLAGPHRAAAP